MKRILLTASLLMGVPAMADELIKGSGIGSIGALNQDWVSFRLPEPVHWITFAVSGIAVNTQTGEVSIPSDMKLTDAAKHFWNGAALIRGTKPPFPEMIKP